MIRVTNSMMVNDLMRNMNNNMQRMDELQRQGSTTKKINKPSDNPAGVVKALRLRTNIIEGEQYIDNIGEAINFMETTDAALNNINQILHRARELTNKAATGSNDTSSRQAIADEIKELNEQLKMIANTTYGTKHVFAGRNVTEEPCRGDEWRGNNEFLELEIGMGNKVVINLNDASMNNFFTGKDDNLSIFKTLDKIVTDIEGGDLTAVSADLGLIDAKMDDLLTCRSTIGARVNRLELQQERLKSTQLSYTNLMSQIEDADMSEVIINLKMQENVYRASLAMGARIIQPTLMDFLR